MNSESINIFLNTIIAASAIIGVAASMHFSNESMKEMVRQRELEHYPLIREKFQTNEIDQMRTLTELENIGNGPAIRTRLWWKILPSQENFSQEAKLEGVERVGIIGVNEKIKIDKQFSSMLFNAIQEYGLETKDTIYKLSYIILYEDTFKHAYIYQAEYDFLDKKMKLRSEFEMARLATKDELELIGGD